MVLSRLELDRKGADSPDGLVRMILKAEPGLSIPVPIDGLCRSLDIEDIQDLNTQGFEGGLITDTDRSRGVILAKGHPYAISPNQAKHPKAAPPKRNDVMLEAPAIGVIVSPGTGMEPSE